MTTEVRRADGRYEIVVDGVVAGFTEVREDDGVLAMPHTVVEDEYEGRGLASQLVRGALDDIRSQGRLIHPFCPYVKSWLQKHDDYQDLVDDPTRFGL
ncbi:MAG TPA: GNAT family N-acetyltransferase [Iamia sp.]|nr:GNAT family N-acetyltransferase [Iamia sp.]